MANERRRVFVTNDPHAMRINKELAGEIGFQDSVVFLQLEYLISISDHEFGGRRWTRQSLEELHEHFTWWSITTLSRILHRLEERNLIAVGQYNRAGYDRTQWYAIDEEGAGELHSIVILQNEKPNPPECETQSARMKNPIRQNETTIPKTSVKTTKKDKEKEGTDVPSKNPKKLKVKDEEAEDRWSELVEDDENGDLLRDFADFRASKNKRGEIKLATLWRQVGAEYSAAKKKLNHAALRHGLREALRREKSDIRYALAVARNCEPEINGEQPSSSPKRRSKVPEGYGRLVPDESIPDRKVGR